MALPNLCNGPTDPVLLLLLRLLLVVVVGKHSHTLSDRCAGQMHKTKGHKPPEGEMGGRGWGGSAIIPVLSLL